MVFLFFESYERASSHIARDLFIQIFKRVEYVLKERVVNKCQANKIY